MPHASTDDNPDWSHVRPLLDDAVGQLGEKDREALLLRFFENRSHRDIAASLGLNDSTVRMRVERALEKLRLLLAKRGITSSASTLSAALLANATLTAPSTLAAQIVTSALAGATAAGSSFTLFQLMTTTQLKAGLAGLAIVTGLTTSLVLQHHSITKLNSENATLVAKVQMVDELEAQNARLSKDVVDRAELELLRLEHQELLRLRTDLASLKKENGQLKEQAASLGSRLMAQIRQDEEEEKAKDRLKAIRLEIEAYRQPIAKALEEALQSYAYTHSNALPPSLSEIVPEPLPEKLRQTLSEELNHSRINDSKQLFQQLSKNFQALSKAADIISGGQLGHVEQFTSEPITSLTSPATTISSRDRQPFLLSSGVWARTYYFADGHSDAAFSPDGDFTSWEKEYAPPK
jgi:type II secretory pathway pseudopilin PulG